MSFRWARSNARGTAIVNLLPLEEGEHPTAVITCRDFPKDEYLLFATKQGVVKKTAMSEYDKTRHDGLIAINLKSGDELINVRRVKPGEKVILVTTDGKAIMFDESEAREMGRAAGGVRGITLKSDATVLGMEITNGNGDLFVVTENGYGKRTPVSEYPEHKRGGQGVQTIAMTDKKGKLVACRVVGPQHELMIMSESGVVIRVRANEIPRLKRATQGVRIMNLPENDHVSAVARMVAKKKQAPKHDSNQMGLDLACCRREGSRRRGSRSISAARKRSTKIRSTGTRSSFPEICKVGRGFPMGSPCCCIYTFI
jgi:DNA gyrase subunit A